MKPLPRGLSMKRKKMGNKPHALPITHIDLSTSRVLTMYDYVVGDLREVTTGRRQSCPFQSDMEFLKHILHQN